MIDEGYTEEANVIMKSIIDDIINLTTIELVDKAIILIANIIMDSDINIEGEKIVNGQIFMELENILQVL